MSKWWVAILVVIALLTGGAVVAVTSGAETLAPARSALHYPWHMLAEDAEVMNDCVECHEPETFHTCASCHDDHGSAELANVPFNSLVQLAGDIPQEGLIAINDILPYRDQPGTHITLVDFLTSQGIDDFESVTLTSRDGGYVTIDRDNLTAEALLMPHTDGIRFAAENLHVSTWLKGISKIVVVGKERPLTIDGYATSYGRLLNGPTQSLTIDQTDVMYASQTDGEIRSAKTAARIEGVPIGSIVENPKFEELLVRDGEGVTHTLAAADARGALLAQLRGRPEVVLVLPRLGRGDWIGSVTEIVSER
jgi:hypothetical protein